MESAAWVCASNNWLHWYYARSSSSVAQGSPDLQEGDRMYTCKERISLDVLCFIYCDCIF